jgi:cyclase
MIHSVDRILAQTDAQTKIVPGHGPVATRADLQDYHDMCLGEEQTLNSLQVQQMTDAVALVEALGSGWDRSRLLNTRPVSEKPLKTDTTIEP